MKTVKIGDIDVDIKASPLTPMYYKQEFKADILIDLSKIGAIEKGSIVMFDTVILEQLIWAMAKTVNGPGKAFPNFEKWLSGFDTIELADQDFALAVIGEAEGGLFCGIHKNHPT